MNMYHPHLLKMSGQMSDNTVQASHFPPDLMVFGLRSRSPRTVCKKKKEEPGRESLKTVPPSYPSVKVSLSISIKGGQEAKRCVLKSDEWWSRARVMTVIYRFSCLCSVHFSAVIHKFTFNSSVKKREEGTADQIY